MVYLVKNSRKFLKLKKNGNFAKKGKFPNSWKEKKDFKKKDGKDSQSLKQSRVMNAMVMDILRRSV